MELFTKLRDAGVFAKNTEGLDADAMTAMPLAGPGVRVDSGLRTGLVIGSALLTLSAFWHPMRRLVVGSLGSIGGRLPPVQTVVAA